MDKIKKNNIINNSKNDIFSSIYSFLIVFFSFLLILMPNIIPFLSNVEKVDTCNVSGYRKPNVIVDIGVDTNKITRNYYGYTNDNGQLVKVTAEKLILQTKEEEKYNGRYCSDEANVPGTEKKEYDQGHVIADSLGGASNAYNITPQNYYLNRKGLQFQLEENFRSILKNHGEITNLEVIINYPTNNTQIPNKYNFTWYQNGHQCNLEFENDNKGIDL